MLYAIFRRARPGSLVDDGIIEVTGGECGHAALMFADGWSISSEAPQGVNWFRYDLHEKLPDGHWLWIVIPMPEEFCHESARLRSWCGTLVGKPYDYLGALNSGEGRDLEDAGKWFCSETTAAGIVRGGAIECPTLVAPDGAKHRVGLRNWLIAQGLHEVEPLCMGIEFNPRSPQWPDVEKEFLKDNPTCENCGEQAETAHHIEPFWKRPDLELDKHNLGAVCRKHDCHLAVGHLFNYKSYNPAFRGDAAHNLERIKHRPKPQGG